MGGSIGEVLPLAVAVALGPVPIIAVILMLGTPHGRLLGTMFALGWVGGLIVVSGLVSLVGDGAEASQGGPATWVSVVKLLFGVLFLLLALRSWHGRPPPGREAPMPRWMQSIDGFSPVRALGFGALMSGVNPKNLALSVAAATTVAAAGLSTGAAVGTLAVYVVVASLSILLPVAAFLILGPRAASVLDPVKVWLSAHNAAIMLILFLVLGAKLVGDGISGLS
jgi:hypothetical protein